MTDRKETDPAIAGAQLVQEASSILKDPNLAPIHAMTANLLDRHGLRTADPDYFRRLAKLVASKGQGNGLREALWNYATQYDRLIGEADPNNTFLPANHPKADPQPFEGDEMSAWIFHFQSRDPASGSHALEQWKRTKSTPWLLAALRHADYDTADRSGLLNAARELPPSSPGYETAAWHYYHLILDGKDKSSVREGIDAILSSAALSSSSDQLFRDLRMTAARDLAEFVRFGARRPLMITNDMDIAQAGGLWYDDNGTKTFAARFPLKLDRFDVGAAKVINNRLPFRMILEAAFNRELPVHLRRELLFVSLTRALMLRMNLAPIAAQLAEIDSSLAPRATAIVRGDSDESRRFAAVHLILWQPEAKPFVAAGISRQTASGRLDDFRDNWWCPVAATDQTQTRGVAVPGFPGQREPTPIFAIQVPGFLTPQDREDAAKERRELVAAGPAMDFLGGIVLDWAASHPNDARVPEALHREIRGSRVTCDGDRETMINRQAFRVLHSRYRNTEWARKTTVR
jgi:hypothetical protein